MPHLVLPGRIVTTIRLFLIANTIIYGFKFNQTTLSLILLTILSLYLLKKRPQVKIDVVNAADLANPYSRMPKSSLSQLPEEKIEQVKSQLFEHFYTDFSYSECLNAFQDIKSNTECVFAKKSNLWSAPKWSEHLSIQDNISYNVLPSFLMFCSFCEDLKLDGYLIRLNGNKYGQNTEDFAKAFCEVLVTLAKLDPTLRNCMAREIERSSWVFEFNRVTFFITTFAPFYPATSSRYAFNSEDCFILFQPEISFAHHDLVADTPETNWTEPRTVRDRIRVAYRDAGRGYTIRPSVKYPMCHDMIKHADPTTTSQIVNWWQYKNLYL